ncbi:MAG: hypothetical protein KGH67_05175, partial [Candidatus Micrarchaeota archaeon]|nr:hypothetical protein [Candidatus Micrarchaeota archaeon]
SNHKDIILIFGESDLSSGYLTLLAANQGRRFCGVLSDHMHIRNKSTGELELRSLQVTSMHRADIGRIIGAHQIDHQAEREIVRA